jgi:hypothetical protein
MSSRYLEISQRNGSLEKQLLVLSLSSSIMVAEIVCLQQLLENPQDLESSLPLTVALKNLFLVILLDQPFTAADDPADMKFKVLMAETRQDALGEVLRLASQHFGILFDELEDKITFPIVDTDNDEQDDLILLTPLHLEESDYPPDFTAADAWDVYRQFADKENNLAVFYPLKDLLALIGSDLRLYAPRQRN